MTIAEITALVVTARDAHQASKSALANAIVKILGPIPNGTTLQVGAHTVAMRKLYCGCSQWSNRSWDVTGDADGYLVDGFLVRDEDVSVWDGHNMHHRKTPLYLDPLGEGSPLRLASAHRLRSLATDLPQAVNDYVSGRREATAANIAATLILSTAPAESVTA